MAKQLIVALVLVVASAGTAWAQPLAWTTGKIFVNASGGFQSSSTREETTNITFSLYEENGTVDVKRTVTGGPLADFTVGGRVFGNFGAAAMLTIRDAAGDGTVTASVPDPIFFDRPRAVTTTLSNMAHRETWIGVLGVYQLSIDDKTSITFMGGPTVVSLKHDIAGTASINEGVSGAEVTLTSQSVEKSYWGFVVGGDFRYMLMKSVGVGAFAKYVGATGSLIGDKKIDLGGFQVGAGIRFVFK